MKDLSKAINESIEEMNKDGTMQKIINEAATVMIKDAVKSTFGYNSPLKREAEAKIQESIKIDLSQVDFSKHNTAMIHSISEAFKNEMLVVQTAEMKQKISSFFKAPEKTIYTIVEFVDELCLQIKDSSIDDFDEGEAVHVSVKSGICGYDFRLTVGEKFRNYRRSVDVRIVIRENEARRNDAGKIFIIHSPSIELGHGGGLEGWLYGLYSHGVKIIGCESFDINDCNLTVWDEGHEDY